MPLLVVFLFWLRSRDMQGAVSAGLWSATGPHSRRRSTAGSLLLGLVGGAFAGAYLMWEFFPNQPLLQVCIPAVTVAASTADAERLVQSISHLLGQSTPCTSQCLQCKSFTMKHPEGGIAFIAHEGGRWYVQILVFGATILASVFLVLIQQHSRQSATWLLYLATVWALLLPVTSFIQVRPDAPPAGAYWTACPCLCCIPQSQDGRNILLRGNFLLKHPNCSPDIPESVQANSDLPPVPGDLQRLYSQSHLVLDAERSAAQR